MKLLLAHRADPEGPISAGSGPSGGSSDQFPPCILEMCEMVSGRHSPIWERLVNAIEAKVDMFDHLYRLQYPDEEGAPADAGYSMPETCVMYYRTWLPSHLMEKINAQRLRFRDDN